MSYKSKVRLIRVQEQLRYAREALKKIAHGGRDPEGVAADALDLIQQGDFKAGGNPENIGDFCP